MNFLSKTLSTLTGTSIPYTIKEKIVDPSSSSLPDARCIWAVYDGVNPKQDNSPITIFEFNLKDPVNIQRDYVSLAKNCFKKSKLIKLPGIISIIDFIENDNYLYIITEPVVPLTTYLNLNRGIISTDAKLFSIYNIGHALSFINTSCKCLHGNLNLFNSVYVNKGGDWKLFGFELLTNLTSDPEQPIYRHSAKLLGFNESLPNEVLNEGIDSIKQFPVKFDSYRFGVFIYSILSNEDFQNLNTNVGQGQLLATNNKIPQKLNIYYKRLVNSNPKLRITIEKFLQDTESFFSNNKLIAFNKQLEEIKFKNDSEKLEFFKIELADFIGDDSNDISFPPGLLENKLLPELINQFNNISNIKPTINSTTEDHQQKQETISIILNYILKFGSALPEADFNKLIKPIIFQTFPLADRSIRITLLTHLSSYAQFLMETEVQSKVFYYLITGFQDTNFMIRETTLKSITVIIDKVSVKQVNQDLLKILAKSQMDPKPSIRVNTLVLIIKISGKIYNNSKNNVLITALSKSLRDSFTPCKLMALSGFESLIDEFSLDEICGKILGHLAVSLMDNKSVKVRKEAKRIFNLYLESVEKHASTLPVSEEDEDAEEKEFFKKYAPNNMQASTQNEASSKNIGGFSFGWTVVNKLVTSSAIGGELDHDFNSSTPDLTRVATPTIPVKTTGNGNTNAIGPRSITSRDEDKVDDGGWNLSNSDDEISEEAPNSELKLPSINKPNVSILARKSATSRSTTTTTRKTSNLRLGSKKQDSKPGSTLVLNLTADEDDDGWGGVGNW